MMMKYVFMGNPPQDEWTPLCFGSRYGHAKVVKMLIDMGADTNVKDKVRLISDTINSRLSGYMLTCRRHH